MTSPTRFRDAGHTPSLGALDGVTGSFAAGFLVYATVAALALWAMVRRQAEWRRGWALGVAV